MFVRFLDAGDFNKVRATTRILLKPGCTTTGFTDHLTNPPTIYINRSVASPGTIVHELLHYVTNRTFERSFSDAIIEGATEYFTQKVLGQATVRSNAAFSAFIGGRSGHYEEELRNVNLAHELIKCDKRKVDRLHYMKRAYFLGDPDSIAVLRNVVGGRE